jgi:hypothetical protein
MIPTDIYEQVLALAHRVGKEIGALTVRLEEAESLNKALLTRLHAFEKRLVALEDKKNVDHLSDFLHNL